MFKIVFFTIALAAVYAEHIERSAQIVNYQSDSHPDGTYQYSYDTTNGIVAQEQGAGGVGASGSFQYVAPDGNVVKVNYGADVNGFVAEGSHIPQIPEAILRSIEWNKAHPEEDNYLHPELDGGARSVQGLPSFTPNVPPSAHY